jgi:hypothetical protein
VHIFWSEGKIALAVVKAFYTMLYFPKGEFIGNNNNTKANLHPEINE